VFAYCTDLYNSKELGRSPKQSRFERSGFPPRQRDW
jgi:hypothetical protein